MTESESMTTSNIEDRDMLSRYCRARAFEQLAFGTSGFSPHWIGDGNRFWYARDLKKGGKEYRLVDAKAATNELAFNHKLLAEILGEAAGETVSADALPIDNPDFSGASVKFCAFGRSWIYDGQSVSETEPVHPPHGLISPDGKKTVFLRDHNLWIRNLVSGEERALTTDGCRHYAYGVQPEARNLVGGLEGSTAPVFVPEALWSPDSRKLFTMQTDERQVAAMPSILYAPQDHSIRPRMVEVKYALPGDKHIPEYRFLIIDVDTGQEIPADYPRVEDSFIWHAPFSGNRAWWSGDGKKAYFLDMTRGQKSARVVETQAETGETRVLFEEHADTYLEIGHFEAPTVLVPVPETDELIWFSQRTGHAHLYLYDLTTGEMKNAITSGDWSVRNATYFDSAHREVIIQTMGSVKERDYYYRGIARVHVDTGEMIKIAASDHDYDMYCDHGALGGVSPNGEYIVSTHGRVNTASVTDLRDREGNVLLTLEESDLSALPEGWRWPEPVQTIADDGQTPIYGVMFRPTDFDPEKKYPVLDFCSSNPFYASVPKQFNSGYVDVALALAELGMVVVMLDGRGTMFRDKTFREYGYGDLLENGGIRDRVAGIKQLAKRYSYMDLNRVGIVDFDGSNAGVAGMLAFAEFYKVGIASSLYDPRLVKQGEVYFGLTTEEQRRQAVVWGDAVHNLRGKLLIMTGLRDSYFHPSATFHLTDALIKANKNFEHIVHPNGAHGWRLIHARRRIWDFLVCHLIGAEPPLPFEMKTGWETSLPGHMTELPLNG